MPAAIEPLIEFHRPRPGEKPGQETLEEKAASDLSFYTSYIAEEIRNEGSVTRGAQDVLLVLEQRGLPVSDAVRTRITECRDDEILRRWLARAVTAPKAEDIFEGE